jgi:hypothetical protein
VIMVGLTRSPVPARQLRFVLVGSSESARRLLQRRARVTALALFWQPRSLVTMPRQLMIVQTS